MSSPMTDASMEFERATMSRVTWRLLPFLLLLYIISWLDRVNLSFAALQMNADLQLSDVAYSFGAGIFFVGYALFEVPSNLLLARFGARIWIARIMITWGILSACMMFVHGEWSLYVLRFLLGVAEAGFLPGIIYYLSHWFPAAYRAKAVSWFMIGIPLSIIFGAPLSGAIMENLDEVSGLHGWQWMFLLEGIPAVILGFVVLGFLTENPSEARWLSAEQRAWLSARIREEHEHAESKHGISLRRVLLHPTVWLLALIMFCCQTGSYGLSFWVPQIMKNLSGLGEFMVGLATAVPYVAAAAGMILLGRSSDRSGERILHVAIPSFIGALGFVATAYLQSPIPALIALAVAAAGDYGTRGPFWALPGKLLTGKASAAGIAFINTMGAVGGFVGPMAVGALRKFTGSYASGLILLAAILCAGGFMTLWLSRSPAFDTRAKS